MDQRLVVFRNYSLAFADLEMKAGCLLDSGAELKNSDDGPALVEVAIHRQELSMPPTIKLEQGTGFGLFHAQSGHQRSWRRAYRSGEG